MLSLRRASVAFTSNLRVFCARLKEREGIFIRESFEFKQNSGECPLCASWSTGVFEFDLHSPRRLQGPKNLKGPSYCHKTGRLSKNYGGIAVLTDAILSGMSGTDLVLQIKATNPGIKALCTSSYADDAVAHHGIKVREVLNS